MRQIVRRCAYLPWAAAPILALAVGGAAQPTDQPAEPPSAERIAPAAAPSPPPTAPPSAFGLAATDFTLRGYTSYESAANLRGDPGEVSVFRAGAEFGTVTTLNRRTRLRFRAESEYVNYDFRFQNKLGGGTPIEEASNHFVSLGIEQSIGEKWGWLARGAVRDGVEGGAKVIDGLGGDVTAGVTYQVRPWLKIGGGALVSQRVEEDIRILPIPIIQADTALNEHWRLILNIPQWGGVVYAPTRDLRFSAGLSVRYNDYRLSSDNQQPEGVFRELSVPLTIQADWRFAPAWTVQVGIGTNIYQHFEVADRNGNEVSSASTSPTAIFSGGLKWEF